MEPATASPVDGELPRGVQSGYGWGDSDEHEGDYDPQMDPPTDGTLSINVDAALARDRGGFGVGCIVRDHTGEVIASQTLFLARGFSPQLAEAYAVLQGIELVRSVGGRRAEIQSDCLGVVRMIDEGVTPATELGTILHRIFREVRELEVFRIMHISRLCNVAAHNLARYAVNHHSSSTWLGLVPPCSEEAIRADDRELRSRAAS